MSQNVFVIGLGNMGAALAGTLLDKGYAITVWNRTESRATALVDAGATLAKSIAEGIIANEVILVCLNNYEDSRNCLSACSDLTDKTLIQLTTGSTKEASDLQAWATQLGGRYLDGAILAYPSGIGSPNCTLLIAGQEAAWSSAQDIILSLGPTSQYLGDKVTAPATLDFAIIFPTVTLMLAVVQSIHALEGTGVSAEAYADMVSPLFGSAGKGIKELANNIALNDFSQTEASLAVWQAALENASKSFRPGPKNLDLVDAVSQILSGAVEHGYGNQNLAAAIEHMRRTPQR
jgi:3-hydroxyisobutyrate dehydrogenase-like beta-hydroxyacid dehydrogenase